MSISDRIYSPDSVTWKIHSNPIMIVAGIRALLEQALHPQAMAGVALNSNFREDSWGRLQRTGEYVSLVTFGPRRQAEELAARVRRVHANLGVDDPKLLLWVHMAMVDSFLDCAVRSGIALSAVEQDAYVNEMISFAELVGLPREQVPSSVAQLHRYFDLISSELKASDDAKRAALFLTFPPMPNKVRFTTPATPLWAGLAALSAASLPKWARDLYNLPSLPGHGAFTNIQLRAFRKSAEAIPSQLFENPYLAAEVTEEVKIQ